MLDGQTELDSLATLMAGVIAQHPGKTKVGVSQTLELRHCVPMGQPENQALLERVWAARGADQSVAGATPPVEDPSPLADSTGDPEVDDAVAADAARDYLPESDDAGVFTGPGIEGNLEDFEATVPPGKSAGCQKLDQLTTERKHEQPAPAGGKNIAMSKSAEGAAASDAPHVVAMSDTIHTALEGSSKAPLHVPGTIISAAAQTVNAPGLHLAAVDGVTVVPHTTTVNSPSDVDGPGILTDHPARLDALFAGSDAAHVTYSNPRMDGNGSIKVKVDYVTVRRQATVEDWSAHLRGEAPLGVIPIRKSDLKCLWGSIDVDEYDVNPLEIIERAEDAGLPLVPCRSKSGGLHLFMFLQEWTPAELLKPLLEGVAGQLGLSNKTEIFPKQIELKDVPGEKPNVGNCLTIPYGTDFGDERRRQVGLKKTGAEMTRGEFLQRAESAKVTPEKFAELLERARSRKSKASGHGGGGAPPDIVAGGGRAKVLRARS
jgi:hypothetical protein